MSDSVYKELLSAKKIALIDDSKAFLAGLKQILHEVNCFTYTFHDARLALKEIEDQKIELIVTDLEMPDFNGFDLVRSVRSNPKISSIPILILTGDDKPETMIKAIEVGADSFASKASIRQTLIAQLYALSRIQDLYREQMKAKQLSAIQSLIGTYKHEFGNGIAAIQGKAKVLERKVPEVKDHEAIKSILDWSRRLTETLEKLDALRRFEESEYNGKTKIVKVG